MKIIHLKCGYQIDPNQISRKDICFSWSSEGAGDQKAYRLQIAHNEHFKSIYVDTQKTDSENNRFIKVRANFSKGTVYYWRVKVYTKDGLEEWSPVAQFKTKHKEFSADWIASVKTRDPMLPSPSTRFRKEFSSSGKITKALLYASAQGNYVAYINGRKCGDEYLTPGWTEYASRIQYQVHDVTGLISEGANCLAAVVSDGWFMGPLAGWQENTRSRFGSERAFFAQLDIEYEDGSSAMVSTNPTWSSDIKSAYTRCEIYYGADYDSRLEDGFFNTGYISGNNSRALGNENNIIPGQGLPIKHIGTINPVGVITTPKGETVVDMGQNMVGIPEISIDGHLGQEVELVFFEALDKDGCVFTDNLRTARQGLNYVLRDGKNVFRPEMTYFGFRYIHVIKWPGKLHKDNIRGLVLSTDIEKTGFFKTNNDNVNKLIENILWSQIGNQLAVPTGCPQRDERLGWTGDAQIFIKSAAFNYDVLGYYDRWLSDMAFSQRKDGSIPNVVPNALDDANCSAGWGEACIIIPWHLYVRYGDIEILSKYYPMMQAFLDYRQETITPEGIINSGFHFGDRLAFDPIAQLGRSEGATPIDLISTAYYAYAAGLMQKIAGKLDKKTDVKKYGKLFEQIKTSFNREFVTPGNRLSGNTQTAYVLALEFGLLGEAAKIRAISDLEKLIKEYKCITCGFLGSQYVLDVLSENGLHGLAMEMALNTDCPSWLYPVTAGATTIWERWNSILPDGSVNCASMNSFNHCAYGSVASWYYEKIAGIIPDHNKPGYKHFFLSPKPSAEINELDCRLKTHYGTIRVYFQMEYRNVIMRVNIPDGTTAHLKLEDCKVYSLDCSRKKYSGEILLESGEHDITYVKGGSILSSVAPE